MFYLQSKDTIMLCFETKCKIKHCITISLIYYSYKYSLQVYGISAIHL